VEGNSLWLVRRLISSRVKEKLKTRLHSNYKRKRSSTFGRYEI